MRRAEWLLLPLFLLPLLGGGAFCLYARDDYLLAVEPYRSDAGRLLEEWIRGSPDEVESLHAEFLRRYAPGAAARGDSASDVPFRWEGVEGEVRLPSTILGREPWTIAGEYPAGLSPWALAAPGARLAIELGASPAGLAGADEATAAFRDLARDIDLDRLRRAPLPVGTKLYLVRRWLRSPGAGPAVLEAERLLAALAACREAPRPLPPGIHRMDGVQVVASGGAWPDLVLPASGPGEPVEPFEARRPVSDVVTLYCRAPGRRGGLRSSPLAAEWGFVTPYGDAWWRGPFFTRWSALAGAVMLALLLLPTALLVAIRRRRRLDEARVRFVNELAHDLRTPLTSLRLYAEMLAAGRVPEEERARYVEVMARESARVSGLLGNLLDLSRLERGARKLVTERLDLDGAAETALADFAAIHPERGEDLRVSGPDGVWVHADRTALGRVLANLLDNAGKFTPPGTPIRLSYGEVGAGEVRIAVADEGPGVPRRERKRIFMRYRRGSAATDGIPGTGMGLSLVRELVLAMGGTVKLSARDRGSTFEVRLPGGRDG